MGDRYSDWNDSYGGGQDDRYADSRYGGSSDYRTSRAGGGQTAAGAQRSSRSYNRQSGDYRSSSAASQGPSSQRASRPSASLRSSRDYSDASRASGTTRRMPQGDDARYRSANNVFEDSIPEDTSVDYSRSAYGSASRGSAQRRSQAAPQRRAASGGASSAQAQRGNARAPRSSAQSYDRSSGQPYSRSYAQSPNGGRYAPKRSNRKRNVIIAVVVVLAVVLIGAGAAWAYVNTIQENLHKGVTQETLDALEPATVTATSLGDAPFYMLLMGADVGGWRTDDEDYIGDQYGRSDSMILTRVDPVNKKVALISIHRDTVVDMGEYGEQKINAAYEFYGPAGAIKAISTMAGVPISHYAVVDFGGFSAIVDALGGVDVNVPMEINDDVIGAHLDAGWQTLTGEQALDLCRSRHSYDDVADDGDVMRAANQRMVIGAIAKKILSSDIMTIASTVQTLSQYVSTDLNVSDIIGLAQIFQGLDPDTDMYTAMEPTVSAYVDDVWYEYLDEAYWKEMISRMDQGLPPVNKTEIDDRTGTILSTGGADAPVV